MAPRAGLEPAAYCLGGKPEPGQTTLTAAYVALTSDDNRLATPDAALLLPKLGSQSGSRWNSREQALTSV